jgi:hypothetical protein
MGKAFDALDDRLTEVVLSQPVFFVATAPDGPGGHVNVSPKGTSGTFAVLDPNTVAYLDLTGSGVETIAHLRENGRITLMFCTFEGPPQIVRLYGRGEVVLPADERFDGLLTVFGDVAGEPGVRSIIVVAVDRVGTSCGYSVPLMDYREDRQVLRRWAERKGPEGIAAYWAAKNGESIDGLPGLALPTRP